jgi:hypothetical protein
MMMSVDKSDLLKGMREEAEEMFQAAIDRVNPYDAVNGSTAHDRSYQD